MPYVVQCRFERRRRSKVRSIARKKSVSSPSPTQPTVSSTCMNPAPQRVCKTNVSDETIALLGRQRKSAGRTLSKVFGKSASQNGMPHTSMEKDRKREEEGKVGSDRVDECERRIIKKKIKNQQ